MLEALLSKALGASLLSGARCRGHIPGLHSTSIQLIPQWWVRLQGCP